mgnify:CR=1 FL=1
MKEIMKKYEESIIGQLRYNSFIRLVYVDP